MTIQLIIAVLGFTVTGLQGAELVPLESLNESKGMSCRCKMTFVDCLHDDIDFHPCWDGKDRNFPNIGRDCKVRTWGPNDDQLCVNGSEGQNCTDQTTEDCIRYEEGECKLTSIFVAGIQQTILSCDTSGVSAVPNGIRLKANGDHCSYTD